MHKHSTKLMGTKRLAQLFAILAAVCYSISAPISKLILDELPPAILAALLYLGAGIGMLVVQCLTPSKSKRIESKLTRKELSYTVAMIALDIAAPILLMLGLAQSNPATVSLLGNFEIVATSVIALVFFREAVGRRMWLAIALITIASLLLTVENVGSLKFSPGLLLVLLACVCWGVENNCTSRLSLKNPLQIVVIKGFGAGAGALIIALLSGSSVWLPLHIIAALALGFVAYGLSIYFYILAQRSLGASRTSAFYAVSPFIGVVLSLIIFRELPAWSFWIALPVMLAGAYLAAFERHSHEHRHEEIYHEHRHSHDDGHHTHNHAEHDGEHSHAHTHSEVSHLHEHTPDTHHSHTHD